MAVKLEVINDKGTMANIFMTDVMVYWPQVRNAVTNYSGDGKEYQVDIFFDQANADALEEVGVNKGVAEIDKTKIKKGKNKGNVKLSSERYELANESGRVFGFKATAPELNKKGKPQRILVKKDGELFTKDFGNGSVVNLKFFAYRVDADEEWNVRLQGIAITDLVEYEGGAKKSELDDEFGFGGDDDYSGADDSSDGFDVDDLPFDD